MHVQNDQQRSFSARRLECLLPTRYRDGAIAGFVQQQRHQQTNGLVVLCDEDLALAGHALRQALSFDWIKESKWWSRYCACSTSCCGRHQTYREETTPRDGCPALM